MRRLRQAGKSLWVIQSTKKRRGDDCTLRARFSVSEYVPAARVVFAWRNKRSECHWAVLTTRFIGES
jgi:hypothetical protein